jgi:uncharacterized membrane protein (DUF485 family)
MSALEATCSTAIGLLVAYVTQLIAFPLFGIHNTSTGVHVGLTLVFTAVSLVRGYCVRRLFNRLGRTNRDRYREVVDAWRAKHHVENDEDYVIKRTGDNK